MYISLFNNKFFKSIISLILTILILNLFLPKEILSTENREEIASRMEKVNLLRASGEFNEAISILNNIIEEYSFSEYVLRYAYNHLVFTYNSMGEKEKALHVAREALETYPDLKVETPDIPPSIDNIYNKLRKEMFGSLNINKPEDCHVLIIQDSLNVFEGITPINLPLIKAGKYTLQVSKTGYHDYTQTINISADEKYNRDNIPLSRDRGAKWWLIRALPLVFITTLTASLLWPEGDTATEPGSLDSPPKPPGQ